MTGSSNCLPTSRRSWGKNLSQATWIVLLIAILIFGVMTFAQAWGMTHYEPVNARSTRLLELSNWDRFLFLFRGPTVRRMENTITPDQIGLSYSVENFRGAKGCRIEAWRIPASSSTGPLVLMFPGYAASKDTLLRAATEFHGWDCETWLIDFSGIGGSEGSQNSIGFREAEDVREAVNAAQAAQGHPRLTILYGTSMGAAAILRAVDCGWVRPDTLILECPFDRLLNTIGNRTRLIGLPPFPFAHSVVFWAGLQQGFNGFAHNPVDCARTVRCPTLLMQGANDQFVGLNHGQEIAHQLGSHGTFKIFPGLGHAYLIKGDPKLWHDSVQTFLQQAALIQ